MVARAGLVVVVIPVVVCYNDGKYKIVMLVQW